MKKYAKLLDEVKTSKNEQGNAIHPYSKCKMCSKYVLV